MTLEARLAASLDQLGITTDAPIGVACSGGSDSVALVHLLVALGRRIVVLHVDHGLRPDSAEDAAAAAQHAAAVGMPFASERVEVDVPRGVSIEAAARDARYAALLRLAAAGGVEHVATAHTLDDQAETVLLRAMRGATVDGVSPSRGPFVRPLLRERRAELRVWLDDRGIAWRDDPSNDDVRFDRNWVRHVVLPQLRERRAGVDAALARVAERARQDGAALDVLAEERFERARVDDIGVLIDAQDLALAPPAIATRLVRLALRRAGTDPSTDQIDRVLSASGPVVIGDVDVWRLPEGIAFLRRAAVDPARIALPDRGVVDDRHRRVRVRVGDGSAEPWRWRRTVPVGAASLHLRRRAAGDRVATAVGTRKVSDVLIDAKVPRPLRDLVGVVADDRGAIALAGLDVSAPPSTSGTVVDVEPFDDQGWARELLWSR